MSDGKQTIEVNIKATELLEAERKRTEDAQKEARIAQKALEDAQREFKTKSELESKEKEAAQLIAQNAEKVRLEKEKEAAKLAEDRKTLEERLTAESKLRSEAEKQIAETNKAKQDAINAEFEKQKTSFLESAKAVITPDNFKSITDMIKTPEDLVRSKIILDEIESARKAYLADAEKRAKAGNGAAGGTVGLNSTAGGQPLGNGNIIDFGGPKEMMEDLYKREELGDPNARRELKDLWTKWAVNAKKRITNMGFQGVGETGIEGEGGATFDGITKNGITTGGLVQELNDHARAVARANRGLK